MILTTLDELELSKKIITAGAHIKTKYSDYIFRPILIQGPFTIQVVNVDSDYRWRIAEHQVFDLVHSTCHLQEVEIL